MQLGAGWRALWEEGPVTPDSVGHLSRVEAFEHGRVGKRLGIREGQKRQGSAPQLLNEWMSHALRARQAPDIVKQGAHFPDETIIRRNNGTPADTQHSSMCPVGAHPVKFLEHTSDETLSGGSAQGPPEGNAPMGSLSVREGPEAHMLKKKDSRMKVGTPDSPPHRRKPMHRPQ